MKKFIVSIILFSLSLFVHSQIPIPIHLTRDMLVKRLWVTDSFKLGNGPWLSSFSFSSTSSSNSNLDQVIQNGATTTHYPYFNVGFSTSNFLITSTLGHSTLLTSNSTISSHRDTFPDKSGVIALRNDLSKIDLTNRHDGYLVNWDNFHNIHVYSKPSLLDTSNRHDGYLVKWDSINKRNVYVQPNTMLSQMFLTLSSGESVYDLSLSKRAKLKLSSNSVLTILNANAGDEGYLIVMQDSIGSRTLTLPYASKVINGGNGIVSLSTSPNAVDIFKFYYDGFNYYFDCTKNYTPQIASSFNVASFDHGASVSASQTGFGSPSYIIDRDRTALSQHWWQGGGGSSTDYIDISFSSASLISEVYIFSLQDNYVTPDAPTSTMTFSSYGITAANVQVWTGSSWFTVGSFSSNNLVWKKLIFSPVTTTKIRINITGSQDGNPRVAEIEAY